MCTKLSSDVSHLRNIPILPSRLENLNGKKTRLSREDHLITLSAVHILQSNVCLVISVFIRANREASSIFDSRERGLCRITSFDIKQSSPRPLSKTSFVSINNWLHILIYERPPRDRAIRYTSPARELWRITTRSIDFESDWWPNSAISAIRLVSGLGTRNEGQEENVKPAFVSSGTRYRT